MLMVVLVVVFVSMLVMVFVSAALFVVVLAAVVMMLMCHIFLFFVFLSAKVRQNFCNRVANAYECRFFATGLRKKCYFCGPNRWWCQYLFVPLSRY